MNDNEREQIIRDCIKIAQSKGLIITPSTWGIEFSDNKDCWVLQKKNNKCCPLASVILFNQNNLSRNIDWRTFCLETLLDVDANWIRNFQLGFDGYNKSSTDDNSFAYELGLILRGELIEPIK